jgi:TolB-like protein
LGACPLEPIVARILQTFVPGWVQYILDDWLFAGKEFIMRRTISLACAAVVSGLLGSAAPVARSQAAVLGSSDTVLVLPFTVDAGAAQQWMGKAVQQDLLTDLTQGTHARVLAPASATAAADPEAAVKSARDLGASIVIFGQAQSTGKEVRLTGQVLEVVDNKPLAAIKATGPSDELFHLEDALAGQVFVALPRPLLTDQAIKSMHDAQKAAAAGQAAAVAPQTGLPQTITPAAPQTGETADSAYAPDNYSPPQYDSSQQVPAYSYTNYEPTPVYTYPTYAYPAPVYSYGEYGCNLFPSYGYGYGFGYGIGVGLGFGFFGGDFDDDFHHHEHREHRPHGDWHDGFHHNFTNQNHLSQGHSPVVSAGHTTQSNVARQGVSASTVSRPGSISIRRSAPSSSVSSAGMAGSFQSAPSQAPASGSGASMAGAHYVGGFHSSGSGASPGAGSSFHAGGVGSASHVSGGGGTSFHSAGGASGGGGAAFHGGGGASHGGGGRR